MILETVAEVFIVAKEEVQLDMDLQTPVQSPESILCDTPAGGGEEKENIQPAAENMTLTCDLCSKVGLSEASLRAHMQEDHFDRGGLASAAALSLANGLQLYACQTCGKEYVSPQKLEAHIQDVHAEKAFSCATCGKSFSRSHHLKIHMRSHTGDRQGKHFLYCIVSLQITGFRTYGT